MKQPTIDYKIENVHVCGFNGLIRGLSYMYVIRLAMIMDANAKWTMPQVKIFITV